jgi:hypothetical protein
VGDGFDLMEIRDDFYSFIRTSDGGCYDQIFRGTSKSREDAWILFKSDVLDKKHGELLSDMYLERVDFPNTNLNCAQYAEAVGENGIKTYWDYRQTIAYQSGKNMQSIESLHFAHKDLSRTENALERFFFTREYGFTRWEAWVPRKKCDSMFPDDSNPDATLRNSSRCRPTSNTHMLNGRCDHNIRLRSNVWGNQEWVMIDCRDSTFYKEVKAPYYPINDQMAVTKVKDVDLSYVQKIDEVATTQAYKNTLDKSEFNFLKGKEDELGMSINVADDTAGVWFSTLNDVELLKGNYRASFSLLLDVTSYSTTDIIFKISVLSAEKTISEITVDRKTFEKEFTFQDIPIDFTVTQEQERISFKVYWYGNSYANFSKLTLESK